LRKQRKVSWKKWSTGIACYLWICSYIKISLLQFLSCSKSDFYLDDIVVTDHFKSGHYYCALMTLRSSIPGLQAAPSSVETSSPLPTSNRKETPPLLQAVLETAEILRNFRRTYGFKTSLAFVFQAAAIVSLLLLNHLGSRANRSPPLTHRMPTDLHDGLVSAFNEAYRCLLAIGTRVMIGRGVARMVVHSSRAGNTPLPDDTQRLLEVVNDIVWTSTDVQQISSNFPNWARKKNLGTGGLDDDMRMERLLKEWEALSLEAS
jgi:hypothetical protein